ncbi:MAG TPA: hypothetical protein VGY54_25805 [Polyangiaceae bacterium]|jgi:hypothetical protein|nr:hypothetical protein [Polyangiaceae bacterium]
MAGKIIPGLPGFADDFLYVIADDGNFYRLTKEEIKTDAHLIKEPTTKGNTDVEVYKMLTQMKEMKGILTDIQPKTKSCICIALNLFYLDGEGANKIENKK